MKKMLRVWNLQLTNEVQHNKDFATYKYNIYSLFVI